MTHAKLTIPDRTSHVSMYEDCNLVRRQGRDVRHADAGKETSLRRDLEIYMPTAIVTGMRQTDKIWYPSIRTGHFAAGIALAGSVHAVRMVRRSARKRVSDLCHIPPRLLAVLSIVKYEPPRSFSLIDRNNAPAETNIKHSLANAYTTLVTKIRAYASGVTTPCRLPK
jgi:hypothetical protein